ncbi:unnamed protein product [Thelazia callipaeda]|uniref:G_PROTEIN_RECEP_F1_2 domain-containing protein n=1 Tax=Thelazia callipaeda TaxID=103827 RepID=A0A0N5CX15_THECL|nr:unnamed protein product [Thelazia callipaeda]
MWQTYTLWTAYLITIKLGIIGNIWVICSVMRNARPRNYRWSCQRPSDRLRSFIFVLAIVDFVVICSLFLRIIYAFDENLVFEKWSCQGLFFLEQISKMASMFCLACISLGRYITIRKPFSSQIRSRFYRSVPVIVFLLFICILIPILFTSEEIETSVDKQDCIINASNQWHQPNSICVALTFTILLVLVSVNYGEIVRHVRQKFSKRKARESANFNNNQQRLSEPRYMREMTSSIARVAVFHIICWLPFCFFSIVSIKTWSLVSVSIRPIQRVKDKQCWVLWVYVIVNWLTYLNSALNWIFYAVMNRDLRELIR